MARILVPCPWRMKASLSSFRNDASGNPSKEDYKSTSIMPKFLILVACRDLKNDDGSSAKISIIRADSGEEVEIGKTSE